METLRPSPISLSLCPLLTDVFTEFCPNILFTANSVIVVTGASSGIGREVALQYARRRCRLVLAARQREPLEAVVALCKSAGSEAIAVATDVTKEEQCKALMEAAVQAYGTIDILVLNAGVGLHHFFHKTQDLSAYRNMVCGLCGVVCGFVFVLYQSRIFIDVCVKQRHVTDGY